MFEPHNKFHQLVDGLITVNKEYRDSLDSRVEPAMSPVEYAMSFCTVKANIGRQTGKSEFIRTRAKETSLVITENYGMRDYLKADNKGTVISVHELMKQEKDFTGYTEIYIDEAPWVFKNIEPIVLYGIVTSSDVDQTFIELG